LCERGKPLTKAFPLDNHNDQFAGGLLKTQVGDKWMGLPLKQTRFDTRVVGTVAETDVTQTFTNPYTDKPIEAIYVFPLADDAAVDDYWIHLGDRHIHGVIKRRDEARKMYEKAREAGQSAALLDQERPNIFTQSVANIPPGGSIEVEMHVVQPLHQEGGRYELSLPTVVGPRFIPGKPVSHKGTGTAPDTDQVPDASKITPPVLTKRVSCAELKVAVGIEGGLPVTKLASKYHRVRTGPFGDQTHVELARDGELPNRDFVLSWSLAGEKPQASLMAQPDADGEGGYFTLTVQPPKMPPGDKQRPRELIFVVDNSGSMGGTPIETAKAAIRKSLQNLGPRDSFQVMRFSETASGMGPTLVANTPENQARAEKYVNDMHSMGGTQMIEGIRASLGFPKTRDDAMRVVLFLTDGYIGNEVQIFEEIEKTLGATRLFSLGVGGSVNRYLLEGMARTGRGAVTYMGPGEKPDKVVNRFYERIAHPVLTDIELDWGSMAVSEVLPGKIPDLFHGQPVVVYGRYSGNPSGTIKLKGSHSGEELNLPVKVNFADATDSEGLASMWARTKVDDLEGYPFVRRDKPESREASKKAVTELALEYSIMTKYTSFVAVDERKVKQADGSYRTVVQPVDLPAGVSGTAVGEAYGVGGLGLVGTGRGGGGTGSGGTIGLGNTGLIGKGGGGGVGSGYGRGTGAGFGGRGKRVPRVRQAKAQVSGSLDKDIIRRIVRAHINEVRSCYNSELAKDPNLKGRVSIKFTIAASGKVSKAKVASSTLSNTTLESCIATAIKRWYFPKPKGGGVVTVTYPFVLEPG